MQLHDERKRYPCDGKENTLSPCQNQTPAFPPLPRLFTQSAGIGSMLTSLRNGQFRVQIMAGKEIYLFSIMGSLTLRSTQPRTQWVLRAHSLEVKWLGCEANHSPLSSTKVKNDWIYISTPPVCLHDMCRNNFTHY